MLKFPMRFEVTSEATDKILSAWSCQAAALPPIPNAIPTEFMGPGTGYSPEDLFALAVLNCLIATYKVYCEKSKLSFDKVLGKAILTVDREGNSFTMSQIDIEINIEGASDPAKAEVLLQSAIRDCAVANSIKSKKSFKTSVS